MRVGEKVRADDGMTGEDVCGFACVVAVAVGSVGDCGESVLRSKKKQKTCTVHRSTTNTIAPIDTQQSFTYSLLPCSHMYEDAIANIVPSGLNDSAATLDGYLRKQTERRIGEG